MSNSAFHGASQWAWDATSLSLLETCPRKYQLKMLEGWHPKHKSVHLLFGGWFAKGLELYYKFLADGDTSETALSRVIRLALLWTWERELLTDDGTVWELDAASDPRCTGNGRPWLSDHPAKTREALIRSLIWYVDQFSDDPITVVEVGGRPAVELSFRMELTPEILLCGHIDRLVNYQGDIYVMDQKTSGSTITPRYFEGFNPNVQMSLYSLAGQVIYGAAIRGVIIDAAQIAVGFTRFTRGFTVRTKDELEEFLLDVKAIIASAHEYAEHGYWPKNTASCGNFGGCEFRSICARSPAMRDNFLRGDFRQSPTWNPLEPR